MISHASDTRKTWNSGYGHSHRAMRGSMRAQGA